MDHMKTTPLLILALAWSFTARADFRYTVSEHNANLIALSGAPDPKITRYYFKGSKILSESGNITRVFDLSAQTETVISKAAKTYSVRNLQETPAHAISAAASLHRQFGMKETGEQKTIDGYACRQIVITMSQDAPPPAPPNVTGQGTIDVWISSDMPGWKDMHAFERNNGSLSFVPWPDETGLIMEFLKLSGMSGFPVRTVVHGGGQPTASQISRIQPQLEKAAEAGGQRAEAAKEVLARISSGGSFGESTQVYSGFSDTEVPEALLEIPAGFTKHSIE
jgi:hypothetical protein